MAGLPSLFPAKSTSQTMARRQNRESATAETSDSNSYEAFGPPSPTNALGPTAHSPLPPRTPTTTAQSPDSHTFMRSTGGRQFNAIASLSLDGLTAQPEVQELLRKAAEWRAISPRDHSASNSPSSRQPRRHGNTRSPPRSSNGGVRLTHTPRMMAPQVAPGLAMEVPAQCLMHPGNGSEPCGCHASQGNGCQKRSVNGAGGHGSVAPTSLNGSANSYNIPIDETPGDPSSIAGDLDRTMSDSEYLPEAEEDEFVLSSASEESEVSEEVHTPLSFQIPEETLRAALAAEPGSAASFYNQNMYRGPDGQLLSIHYCHNMEIARRVLPYFLEETVLGFDIEWKPFGSPESIKENVSLIQIASEDRVALFHISLYRGTTPEELLPADLKTIIESPDILKVGVAIKGDFSRVAKYLGVKPQGVFELSRLHNLVENYNDNPSKASSKALFALAKQVHQHLQLPMYKGAVRESDWSKRLQLDQMAYAATDAYASLRIYDALEKKRKALRPIPPQPDVCDHDEPTRPPRPKTSLRSRPARKATDAPGKEDDPAQEEVQQSDEGTSSAFETAAEDLFDSHELEDASETELSTTDAKLQLDHDAEYVPPSVDQAQVEHQLVDTSVTPRMTRQRRCVGRVKLGTMERSDPAYPNLPPMASRECDSANLATPNENVSAATSSQEQALGASDVLTTKTLESHAEGQSPATQAESKDPQGRLSAINLDERAEKDVTFRRDDRKEGLKKEGVSLSKVQSGRETAKEMDNLSANSASPWSSTLPCLSEPAPALADTSNEAPRRRKVRPTDASPSECHDPTTPTPKPIFKPLQSEPPPKSAQCSAAESWAQAYLFNTIPSASATAPITPSRVRATMSHLRAYHLWHHQHMSVDEVSRQLRDPPLAESTVCNYILQAIALERLEYRKEGVRQVLRALPMSLRITRWKFFIEKVGGV